MTFLEFLPASVEGRYLLDLIIVWKSHCTNFKVEVTSFNVNFRSCYTFIRGYMFE